jgi:hypothetical protein
MFHHPSELPPDIAGPDQLRAFARDKGLVAQRALRPNLWRLIKADGTPALNPVTNDTGFGFHEAIDFLNERPDNPF